MPSPQSERQRRARQPTAEEAISWQLADEATRTLAMQTLETLNSRETVARLAERYANVGSGQRAGHLFEVMHALSFNKDAIAHDASVRASVSEWASGGSQTAGSDVNLLEGDHALDQAQAKLYDSTSMAAHEVARAHYDGMQRLVAEDRYDAIEKLLDRKVTLHPDGNNTEHYRDAHANLTAVLHHQHVSSDPISYEHAQRAAEHPMRWADQEVGEAAAKEILTGVAVAGGAAAVISALVSAAGVTAKVRAGEMTSTEAAISACSAAARTGARSSGAAGVGGLVEGAAHLHLLVDGLGSGTLPIAMGRAVVGVAEAGFSFAQGDIDSSKFALRSSEAAARSSIVWAFSAIGQTVIPAPVVGAMAGAFVGQLVGAQCIKGLQMAIVAARQDKADEARLAALETELLTAVALTEELAALTTQIGSERSAYLSTVVMPRVDAARRSLLLDDADDMFARFAEIIASFGGQPLFTTMSEFDDWMAKGDVLVLDGNCR